MNIVIHEDALNRLPGNFLVVLRRLLSRVLTPNSYLAWDANLMITISLGVIVSTIFSLSALLHGHTCIYHRGR